MTMRLQLFSPLITLLRLRSVVLLFLLFLSSQVMADESFEDLMGKGTAVWQHVCTPEDFKRLEFFKKLYESVKVKELPLQTRAIPKTLHFIWLGPKEISVTNYRDLESWVEKHPGWKIKFWTDIPRTIPIPEVEVRYIPDFPFSRLVEQYYRSDNFGEKSQLLRYLILFEEGGVYADLDTRSLHSLETLHPAFEFYCGLETLDKTVLSSSIYCSPHLIAAVPRHPILEYAIGWLEKNWDILEQSYPGNDPLSIHYRVLSRTTSALEKGVEKSAGSRDVVFPPSYFSMNKESDNQVAMHFHHKSWYLDPDAFENKTAVQFDQITQRTREALLITLFSSLLTFLTFAGLFFYIKNKLRGPHETSS